jgi:hypothetical protein
VGYRIALLMFLLQDLFDLVVRELREHGDELIRSLLVARQCMDPLRVIAVALGLMAFDH